LQIRRFCELIDPDCDQYDARYRRVILAESERATRELAPPTVTESKALVRAMKACAFWSGGMIGCGCGHCGLRRGTAVSHLECFACIKSYGGL
jgi:hypothetical protein